MQRFRRFRLEHSEDQTIPNTPPIADESIDGSALLQMPLQDLQEIDRLNRQHDLLRQALGGNYSVPLATTIQNILDVGNGSGLWAHEMAIDFPQAQVIGLDWDDIKHELWTPCPNYRFVQGDLLQDLPFDDQSFDYVHQRALHMSIPTDRWAPHIRELVRVTQAGGWIEFLEAGNTILNAGPLTGEFVQWGVEAGRLRNIDPSQSKWFGPWLMDAGLQQVQTRTLELPLGKWGHHVGSWMAQNIFEFYMSLKDFYCSTLSLPPDVFDQTISALPKEWEAFHSSYRYYWACGQK